MTLTIELDLDIIQVDLHVESLFSMLNGSVLRVRTHTHTNHSDSITLTVHAEGNKDGNVLVKHSLALLLTSG